MALNKKAEFEIEEQNLAQFAKAIAHPARIAILNTIAERKECICGEIVEVLPLAQATVSQHLRELKEIGLITGEIEGTKSCYCINWENLERFQESYKEFFSNIKKHKPRSKKDCC
ncbi:DNA-binding helix-turn-helix protein [Leptospira broomii serovar Hurstbridge str. 5399]|uniref:DNA-binding helix-turn-helix protein n=1 Tax=Leptospira broomii serovar Hurstbridge str. 5399 TaxID=1049789 RepID=T0F0L3_9LEPT|nr:metalloregulator ArsR/SmtB family transcription factor [Leptospira broomii]EQA44685.1 DNA-binding helix-turn-helix protein [Leptospira broomii serovar Hurstbridge str. 5399]TGM09670.1 ArsR family transcriptional regulator [Leptospira yasudae]